MVRKSILALLFFFKVSIMLMGQEKAIWPIENESIGENVLYQPQEYIENERNTSSLIIFGKEGDLIIAPTNGKINNCKISYLSSLSYSQGSFLEVNKPYSEQKNEFEKYLKGKVNPKFLNITISVLTESGEIYTIRGLEPDMIFKSGEIIKKGQILGYMSYAYQKIQKPCIMLSASKNSKSIDPMFLFGLKSSFINEDLFADYDTKKHSPEKLKEALGIIRESLEDGHPGLYDYSDKDKIDHLFDSVSVKLTIPMTSEELRKLLIPLLVAIGDSHLGIYGQGKISMPPFPPVLFGFENGKVKTFVALEDYQSFINKEIIEINGVSIQSIIKKLRDHIPGSDGLIESGQNETLLLNMSPFYCEVYNIKAGDSLTYKFSDNSTASFTCKQFTGNDKYFPDFHYSREDFRCKSSYISENIAYLKIKTFELYDTDKDSIRNFMSKISKTNCPYLIIDLRGNKGGEIFDLFGMVASEPYNELLYTMVKKQDFKFFKYTYNYLPEMTGFFSDYQLNKDGYYLFKQSVSPVNDSISYKGHLYVLTDANSMSASTIFAGMVHKNRRGVIIGQETGTTYHQMNAVKFASVNIANTGLTMRMPLVKCVFDKSTQSDLPWGRGVIPDYPLDLKFEDYFSDKDRILNFVLDLIKKNDQGN